MEEIIYQPTFDESEKIDGYIMMVDVFYLKGFIFCFSGELIPRPRKWRESLIGEICANLVAHTLTIEENGRLTDDQKLIRNNKDTFDFEWMWHIERNNLQIYNHTPNKLGGYIRVTTEPDDNENVKPNVDEQEYYPADVFKSGPVEKFLFDNIDSLELEIRMHESMKMADNHNGMLWRFGKDLEIDEKIYHLYFNDTIAWNDLYWDIYHAIGNQWKRFDFIEAWRYEGIEKERKLVAETEAQKFLFWIMCNEYSLDELHEMIETKTVIERQ